jgi:hypothetical protein
MRQHAGEMKSGFADADDRRNRKRPRRIEPRVVEAGDHVGVGALRLAFGDAGQQPRYRECVVVSAFDRGGAERGFNRADDRIRPRHFGGGRRNGAGHRRGGIRIDDVEAHEFPL